MARYQLLLYLSALAAGTAAGVYLIGGSRFTELAIWPCLAALLYTTFCHVQPAEAARVLHERRFVAASLLGNFVVVPLFVWLLVGLLPLEPAIALGVYLVLLVPCTDWFVTFTHLGRGNSVLATALTPLLLLGQLVALPLYLLLFLGQEYTGAVQVEPFVAAFGGLIVLPFLAGSASRQWAVRSRVGASWLRWTGELAIALLAAVIFLIAASQAQTILDEIGKLAWAPLMFALYLVFAALLARLAASRFSLGIAAGRTLAFNFGTRNSFVVLPLALALPAGWEAAVAVIVMQSFVELAGMIGFLWAIPRWLFRDEPSPA